MSLSTGSKEEISKEDVTERYVTVRNSSVQGFVLAAESVK